MAALKRSRLLGAIALGVVAAGVVFAALRLGRSPDEVRAPPPPPAPPSAAVADAPSSEPAAATAVPSADVDTEGLPAVAAPAVALARPGGHPIGIAVTRDALYWMAGDRLMKLPARGAGSAVAVARGAALAQLVADDSGVYWIATLTLMALPRGSERPVPVFALPSRYLDGLAVDERWVYSGFTDDRPFLFRTPKVRSPDRELEMDLAWPPRRLSESVLVVAVDAMHVYGLTDRKPQSPSQPRGGADIVKLPKARSEEPTVVARDVITAGWPVVKRSRVLYADVAAGTVVVTTGAPGGETVLATDQRRPGAVLADDRFAYWVDVDGLMRVKLAGGVPERVARERGIWRIAQDDANLYWISATSVARVPKDAGAPR